ncbi:protoporphyrinogen oxidase [Dysgonomonas macrotermitis]|uniref:Coproporphyrinogen III oxidase n=1 Tax=Dysgonomonas macrotermitis TaxID=1346286 RepID=A0A1M5CK03_9BACT|nr:protoporphyrinogen oxidase [Dysgonomonas macrotermitis]SHF54752.1 oxygen-dependent protoporphyrinogen oxidase [Dysgonomonas macrotermitis]
MEYDVIVIGAGLTGLSLAFFLQQKGKKVIVLEKMNRAGGAMHTHSENGFIYEEGPNTGVLGNPEIAELFEMLEIKPVVADKKAEKRLIYKNKNWYALPSGPVSFLKTPLFTLKDKIKIAFEPFVKRGTDPDESVASIASRRIGQSFVDYAVNPFISGIYAGDPEKLTTRYALPKLYKLEQKYGSFIGGSFKKSREPKNARDKKATKEVFSGAVGFGSLIEALVNKIGKENIVCGALDIKVKKVSDRFEVTFNKDQIKQQYLSYKVISSVGANALPDLLPFISPLDMKKMTNLTYAKVVQVAVGVERKAINDKYVSFGGLIPQKENRQLLGVLFPSFCFPDRAPQGYATLAIYLGGTRHPELFDLSDEKLTAIVHEELKDLFKIPSSAICFLKIFRHRYAIPQYEVSTGERLATIAKVEKDHDGLYIAGNIRNGIGIADRVKQAYDIAEQLVWKTAVHYV